MQDDDDGMMATCDALMEKTTRRCVDVSAEVEKIKVTHAARVKRIKELEMILANDKKELYEDPLQCHALHMLNAVKKN